MGDSTKHAHHQQTQQADVSSLTDLTEVKLSKYEAAPCQPRVSDPLTWWHDNMAMFPLLSVVSREVRNHPTPPKFEALIKGDPFEFRNQTWQAKS